VVCIAHNGERYELVLDFPTAMYLRNHLNALERDAGFGVFSEPPA
jgi:hypothetical protein